jgi:enoyl-CoA hydratase/carnithine racemase
MAVPNPLVTFDQYRTRYQHIRMDRDDGILQMTFHKEGGPFRLCALAHAELCDAFYQVSADHENRLVILTGTGDVFCAAWDRDFDHSSGDAIAKAHWEGRRLLQNLLDVEAPVIAAINGPSLVHCFPVVADITLCSENATFMDGHISEIGVAVGDGASTVWQYLMGPTRAKYFLLMGQTIDARQAVDYGVVNEVLPQARLLDRAWEIARELARRPQTALRYSRIILNHQYRRLMQEEIAMSYGLQYLGGATTRHPHFGRKVLAS